MCRQIRRWQRSDGGLIQAVVVAPSVERLWFASLSTGRRWNVSEPCPSNPRMNFAEAVQRLGMEELTFRHPHVPEPILKELLIGVLELFEGALNRARAAADVTT